MILFKKTGLDLALLPPSKLICMQVRDWTSTDDPPTVVALRHVKNTPCEIFDFADFGALWPPDHQRLNKFLGLLEEKSAGTENVNEFGYLSSSILCNAAFWS